MQSPREGECDRSIGSCQGLTRVSTAGSIDTGKLIESTHNDSGQAFRVVT